VTGRLADRVALVTGAGSGIGRATALRFAAEGARLVVNDRDGDAVAATARSIAEDGGEAVVAVGDVVRAVDVEAAVALAVDTWGRIDVLHNNAGYGLPDEVATLTDELLDELLRVNLFGALHGTRAALPHMVRQGGGSIVNTASNAALAAADHRTAYGIAKAGLVQLTRSTAVEHGRHGVRANAILPGPVLTPAFERFAPDLGYYAAQIPMKRLGTAEDVAAVALFLASDDAAYVSGVAISVDGAASARLVAPHLRPEDVTR
jgi:NAD(P)-dependent dehydrogenase (short-subunit alcohol dehydrogenase family)